MKNKYPVLLLQFIAVLLFALSSCKKDNASNSGANNGPVSIGLFEQSNGANDRIFIPISKIGTQTVTYDEVFDTGSVGLTIDATNIIPAAMFTSSGFSLTADTVVNGITITPQTFTMSYGDALSSTKEYGNLAYATITIPNNGSNGLTIQKVPMFLYYKIVDGKNNPLPAHSGDIFGVGPGVSFTNSAIGSPLSYYTPGSGLTNGFKLAMLNNADFTSKGTYVAALLTVGLTQADLTSSGFIMHPLSFATQGGYSPDIPATIAYSGNAIAAQVLFDTGTPQISIIENKLASVGPLPQNTMVTVTTNKGFTYTYTTTQTSNLTEVQNPNNTNDIRTVFSIDFFAANEFLTDYSSHQIGLKNN